MTITDSIVTKLVDFIILASIAMGVYILFKTYRHTKKEEELEHKLIRKVLSLIQKEQIIYKYIGRNSYSRDCTNYYFNFGTFTLYFDFESNLLYTLVKNDNLYYNLDILAEYWNDITEYYMSFEIDGTNIERVFYDKEIIRLFLSEIYKRFDRDFNKMVSNTEEQHKLYEQERQNNTKKFLDNI